MIVVERGDVLLVSLDPSLGSEASKTRPCVVVSSNAVNDSIARRGRGVLTVVPVTSNVRTIYPFQVLLRREESGLPIDSKAQAEQVRSISSDRVVRPLGRIAGARLRELDDALRLHLAL